MITPRWIKYKVIKHTTHIYNYSPIERHDDKAPLSPSCYSPHYQPDSDKGRTNLAACLVVSFVISVPWLVKCKKHSPEILTFFFITACAWVKWYFMSLSSCFCFAMLLKTSAGTCQWRFLIRRCYKRVNTGFNKWSNLPKVGGLCILGCMIRLLELNWLQGHKL